MKYAGLLFINIAFTFAGIFAARGLNEKIKVSHLLIEMADMMAAMLSFSAENSVKIIHSLANETSLSKLTFLKNIDFENISVSTCLDDCDNERTALLLKMLGNTDVNTMLNNIEAYKSCMEMSVQRYNDYYKNHAKLFVAFGIMGGMLITILVI